MIKKTFSLSAALLFTLLFSVTCFAADSPTGTVIPTTQAPTTVAPTTKTTETTTTKKSNKKNNKKNQNGDGGSDNNNSGNEGSGSGNNYIGRNTSQTSPKTGYALTGAFIAIISSAGVALISKKKMEAEE